MSKEFDVKKIRADFPQLTKKVRGKPLIYLDSAATALKPWPVIEKISHFNSYEVSNVHRGAHFFADQATSQFEATREAVAQFVHSKSSSEIVFTKGATEAINLVAATFGRTQVKAGDRVLITQMEHHANIIPWQILCQHTGAKLEVAPILPTGELDILAFEKLLTPQVKLLAITHCSNHLGTINPIKELVAKAHSVGAKVLVDGAQMIANHPVDVQDLDCDFYVFSAHKLFGPFGLGVLFGKREILESMPPYQSGGNMISTVSFLETTYNEVPYKFEAGTPNIEAVLAFKSALEYVNSIGYSGLIAHENDLLTKATAELKNISGLRILGEAKNKAAIISFVIEGLHHSDIAQILDQEGIAVRAGHHCTQPLIRVMGVAGSVRASFSIYNMESEIPKLAQAVQKAKEMLS